ncbi:MAG: phytanoyl-CoA dioxygenase family protein, partial [Pseudomonadota bacterium]
MALIEALTKEQTARLGEQGYLGLPKFASAAEVAEIGAIFDHLLASKAGWQDGNQFDLAGTDDGADARLPQILFPSQYAPALKNHAVVERARQIAETYFGEAPQADHGEHMIFKPPDTGAVTPWHQDQAYHDPTMNERALNFWIPLDDCDEQ